MDTQKNKSIQIVAMGALTVSLSFIFSNIVLFKMPFGGSITMASSSPLIVFSLMYGTSYGVCASFCYGLLQIISGFYAPPVKSILSFVVVIFLDYLVPYSLLGTAHFFGQKFKSPFCKGLFSAIILGAIRYLSSFISGILIWGSLAPNDLPVWQYSLIYNFIYIVPEIILTSVCCAFGFRYLKDLAIKNL